VEQHELPTQHLHHSFLDHTLAVVAVTVQTADQLLKQYFPLLLYLVAVVLVVMDQQAQSLDLQYTMVAAVLVAMVLVVQLQPAEDKVVADQLPVLMALMAQAAVVLVAVHWTCSRLDAVVQVS
jgi:hypothetical protein